MLIDQKLLDQVSQQAQESPRLRMNHNFHDAPTSPSQRLLNALEPGTVLPIHRHRHTSESYVLLRGRIDVMFCDAAGHTTATFHLDPLMGNYGVQIPRGQWHTLQVLASGSVIFEAKDGPYTPLAPEDLLE
ncbi:MAG: WbuC family cupin fold metalloprotein [Alistipes sp.]